ncbi:urease accessory protein UreE [Teredinibacter turnerae]|uniref:urease accessory protein UreE n=1 Tax=Teredinibacter turnerae TaxID=2426 RepID=UPI00037D7740|nr:urease accessory protein UreE [Teredinibacter turnerae]
MLEAYEKAEPSPELEVTDRVVVSFDDRKKSRHRVTTERGVELGWFLERGLVLADGEILKCTDGTFVRVCAADESVSDVHSDNTLLLTRAAYHLGNRHVPLEVGAGYLRYQHDHVLDDMVRGLGLHVAAARAPFNPENGAYHGSGGHHHDHDHDHE